MVKLWQTLGFTADVLARLSIATQHLLSVNLARTDGAILAGFARTAATSINWPQLLLAKSEPGTLQYGSGVPKVCLRNLADYG
jgi:hypothetical protein